MTKNKRLNPIEKAKANPKSLRAAINGKCFECSDYTYKNVRLCLVEECSLWPQRPWQGNKTTRKGKN